MNGYFCCMGIPSKSFLLRHKLISGLRDLDVKGIRRLSVSLPYWLLPPGEKVGKHVLKTLHGVDLLIDPTIDRGVELSLYETGTYEKGTIQLLHQFLKPGSVFLDVGANIGLMSCVAGKRVGEAGKVIAVEANPKTVEILQYNIEINNLQNVEILPVGVSDEVGSALIYENWTVNRGGASLIKHADEPGIEIRIETLDHLYEPEAQLDLVKIDVEGKEPEVIAGGLAWFRKQLPVFIVEVSESRGNQSGATPQQTVDAIRRVGDYRFFKQKGTKERRGPLVPIRSDEELPEHDNVIAIPIR